MAKAPPATTPVEPRRLPPLLRRTWYALNQAFRQRVSHLEITPDQYSILRWLSEGDKAGLTQREISDLMASDPNTITSTLTRMERAGLVQRATHEADRRAKRVSLRAKGRRTLEQAREVAARLEKQVLAGLPAEEREQFLATLERVAEACGGALGE